MIDVHAEALKWKLDRIDKSLMTAERTLWEAKQSITLMPDNILNEPTLAPLLTKAHAALHEAWSAAIERVESEFDCLEVQRLRELGRPDLAERFEALMSEESA